MTIDVVEFSVCILAILMMIGVAPFGPITVGILIILLMFKLKVTF